MGRLSGTVFHPFRFRPSQKYLAVLTVGCAGVAQPAKCDAVRFGGLHSTGKLLFPRRFVMFPDLGANLLRPRPPKASGSPRLARHAARFGSRNSCRVPLGGQARRAPAIDPGRHHLYILIAHAFYFSRDVRSLPAIDVRAVERPTESTCPPAVTPGASVFGSRFRAPGTWPAAQTRGALTSMT